MKKTGILDLENRIKKLGRTYTDRDNGVLYFNWTCSGLEFVFRGSCLIASFCAQPGIETDPAGITGEVKERTIWPWAAVYLDDAEIADRCFELSKDTGTHLIFQSEEAETHKIRIVKLTENLKTGAGIDTIYMEGEILPQEDSAPKGRIEFIGDSITCGFGNETTEKDRMFFSAEENGWLTHGAIAARTLNMDWSMVCVSGICLGKREAIPMPYAMNDLYSYTDRILEDRLGKTDYQRWDFSSHPSDYIVLNLGTNDATGITGSQNPEKEEERFHEDYLAFLHTLRKCNGPETRIICALGSMNYYLYHDIVEIVKEYQKDTGDQNIRYFRYPQIDFMDPIGACSHPHKITHMKMAQALTAFIRNWETKTVDQMQRRKR